MKLKNDFELINFVDEYMAVPIGKNTAEFKGVVVLNEAAFYLLSNMKENVNDTRLIELLIDQYDVDEATAESDVKQFISDMFEMGLLD